MLEQDWEAAKLALSHAADNRRAEIALLWSRSLYFWGFIAVVLVAYGGAYEKGYKRLSLTAACFGTICSLCWTLANRSSKYWQLVWEKKTEYFAVPVVGLKVFPRESNPKVDQRWFWGAKEYSPSKLVMAVSDLSVVTWALLAVASLSLDDALFDFLAIVGTAFYAFVILVWCKSGPPRTWAEAKGLFCGRMRMGVEWVCKKVS